MEKEIPTYVDTIPRSDKFYRLIWRLVSLFLFKPFSLPIFNLWRAFLLKLFGAKIGKGSIIHASAYIPSPKNLKVGKESAIGPEVKLHIGLTLIGNKVTISQRSYLCSATHKIDSINTPFISGKIEIEDFAWVAAESFIMNNTRIGEGAIVGARSAVFKDIAPWTVVGGNPAKFLKERIVHEH
ncbi:putative colanic acid biosynthesis acetyltransferase [Christiangramia flava]|uniref:Colanic acid biosynthesis acetyltransferase WcaF n=1 Tax=Christiangramia flava JLT2011 TaxID=1229726 RepID=A0A1L7I4Z0_9FLAO|nr:putative colanic acid biosynthesis acetyltransferase [Christiangramia flava]APU68661.1 Colanic acid biosynthesis acetyltransferase WcaF [Christiangramia flava JLT2011]OSS38185.1 putative acetyltransferase [Christiangramia flava JLT2011]